jgi:hypothetical protein
MQTADEVGLGKNNSLWLRAVELQRNQMTASTMDRSELTMTVRMEKKQQQCRKGWSWKRLLRKEIGAVGNLKGQFQAEPESVQVQTGRTDWRHQTKESSTRI